MRIGNYLLDQENRLCVVEKIEIDNVYAPAIRGGMTSLPNKEIPLTEEWLVKLGFETDGITYEKGCLCLGHYKDDVFLYLPSRNISKQGIEVKYIHQLQNLFYALSGEGLTCQK